MMFLDCPAFADKAGWLRCGLPAEVEYRYMQTSTDGPLESAKIRCPQGHWFNAPIEFLTWQKNADATQRLGVQRTVAAAETQYDR